MFVPLFRSDFSFSRYALFKSFSTGAASIFLWLSFFQARRRNKLVPLRPHPEVVGDSGAGDGDDGDDDSAGGDGGSNSGIDDSGSSIST